MTVHRVAIGGERLDRIARAYYGTERGGTVEALLDANPGLADLGAIVPEATAIDIPAEVETKPATTFTYAWE